MSQRYYSSQVGRFLTPDPYQAGTGSGDPADPQSWNRYSYVQSDPVNFIDPRGLMRADPDYRRGPAGPYLGPDCGLGWATDPSLIGPCEGPGGGGIVDDAGNKPPDPSCTVSVATSGSPRDGQSVVGLVPYSPAKNRLRSYTTVRDAGLGPRFRGWFFAVQIQGNPSGDTNAPDWAATQSMSISGQLTISQLRGGTVTSSYTSSNPHDDPLALATYRGTGRLDWLDIPGFGKYQPNGGIVVGADLTFSVKSTLTHDNGASCSKTWSLHLVVDRNNWTFKP